MTKKAQFIIPNVFIKEAFGAGMTRGLMQVGQLLTRANKGPVNASLMRAINSGVRRGTPRPLGTTVLPVFKDLRAAGTTRGSVSRNELAAKLRALRAGKTIPKTSTPPPLPKTSTPPPLPKTSTPPPLPKTSTPPPLPNTASVKPGLINRANRALSSTVGRVALPVATGVVGYGLGNSRGYDEGFGQGSLSAQQMAAIQAMQAQQQARQMYDNQGFLDRLMGNNPF